MAPHHFKNRIRNRVCGILTREDAVLLVQLKSPVTDELVWMPPGGGLEFGETMQACLQREFEEETGLQVEAGDLAFVQEMVAEPFHAVEHYFFVESTGGKLRLGHDPELSDDEQLLKDLRWIPVERLHDYEVRPTQLAGLITHPESLTPFYSA